jgi:hypothetical protein
MKKCKIIFNDYGTTLENHYFVWAEKANISSVRIALLEY